MAEVVYIRNRCLCGEKVNTCGVLAGRTVQYVCSNCDRLIRIKPELFVIAGNLWDKVGKRVESEHKRHNP